MQKQASIFPLITDAVEVLTATLKIQSSGMLYYGSGYQIPKFQRIILPVSLVQAVKIEYLCAGSWTYYVLVGLDDWAGKLFTHQTSITSKHTELSFLFLTVMFKKHGEHYF